MDPKSIGNNILKLRKINGWTQAYLAERLGITDKAVSRWESGQGYPDIELIPRLAELFCVTIDRLILGERKGIAIAGTILVDIVKNISEYPKIGMLTHVSGQTIAVGGCVPNTAIDLAKIDSSLPVSAVAKVGSDENGKYLVSQLSKNGVDVSRITYSRELPTGCDDVMSCPDGERTFFLQRGANDEFYPEDIDIDNLNCAIFHIGYIFLMQQFDAPDPQYGTVLARFLKKVQEKGIKTSIDMVSDSGANYGEKVIPVLKYCDYVIINEIECCTIWGIDPRNPDDTLNVDNVRLAMEKTIEAGVKDRVIVHAKEAGFMIDREGNFTAVPSLKIPKELIKGSVGAGDAFCAGSLYGIYNGYNAETLLRFASCAAASNLFSENSIDGMLNKIEIEKLEERFGRRSI